MLKCLSVLSKPLSSLNRTTLMRSNLFRFQTTHIKLFTINYAMHPDHHMMYCVHYSVYPIQHIMDRGSMICWPPSVRIQTILNNSAMENKKNKNYYVVGDAGFARPRNTLKIISNFFLINQ